MTDYTVKRFILALAIQAEIEGMKAHNKHNETHRVYGQEAFDEKAEELNTLANKHDEQL